MVGRVESFPRKLRSILTQALKGKLPMARVVVNRDGRTPRRQHVLSSLNALQKRHGLRKRSVHSLRHCFCSTLIRSGASVEAVRLLAGHADLKDTQRYVHAVAADLEAAIKRSFGQPVGNGSTSQKASG